MNRQTVRQVAFGEITERQWFPKSRNPFKPGEIPMGASVKVRAREGQLRAMARQGGSLYHEKPPERCDTRRHSYETGARGLQRDIVQAANRPKARVQQSRQRMTRQSVNRSPDTIQGHESTLH